MGGGLPSPMKGYLWHSLWHPASSYRTVFAAQQPCTLVPRAASPRLVIPLGPSWTTTAKGDTAVVLVYEELTEPERAVWDAIEADGLVELPLGARRVTIRPLARPGEDRQVRATL
jgi:hypothetical protein